MEGVRIAKDILCRTLGASPDSISPNQGLIELGLDSVKGEQFLGLLAEAMGVDHLPATVIYENPTIYALGAYIDNFGHKVQLPKIRQKSVSEVDQVVQLAGCCCRFLGHEESLTGFKDLVLCGKGYGTPLPPFRCFIGKPDWNIIVGLIDNIEHFDCAFFRISPREAVLIDPKQRLMLETSYSALQNAAVNMRKVKERHSSVLVGAWSNDYASLVTSATGDVTVAQIAGKSEAIAAGRMSYFFDAKGPAMTIDTACSSGAVAVHLASKMLRDGEIELAICSAANLCFDADIFNAFRKNGLLSPSGMCRTFDVEADGYLRSEGVATLIFELESTCSHKLAILGSSACNQDGQSAGLFAPNSRAQIAVALEAMGRCPPQLSVDFVEAHGTGTLVGDEVEMSSIMTVHAPSQDHPLILGSVKSMIGHTEACAGLAGLIRSSLLFTAGTGIHLHLKCLKSTENADKILLPFLEIDRTVNSSCTNSYGFSGTNVSLVMQRAVSAAQKGRLSYYLLPLSGKSFTALERKLYRFSVCLTQTEKQISTVVSAVQRQSEQFKHRILGKGYTSLELVNSLKLGTGNYKVDRMGWLFTGQGSERYNMGLALYNSNTRFHQAMVECEAMFQAIADHYSLIHRNLKWNFLNSVTGAAAKLTDLQRQLCLFCLEYSLTELWRAWGVEPYALMGHSFGECMATTMAGFFTLREACMLVTARALMVARFTIPGKMLATNCSETQIEFIPPWVNGVDIACYNCPGQIVLSGDSKGLQEAKSALSWCGQRSTIVSDRPFHSRNMEPVANQMRKYTGHINFKPSSLRFISSVTGEEINEMNDNYWSEQIVSPVKFNASVDTMVKKNVNSFLEVGPEPLLLDLVGRCLRHKTSNISHGLLQSLSYKNDDWRAISVTLSELFVAGINLNWCRAGSVSDFGPATFPSYPFDEKRFWIDAPERVAAEKDKEIVRKHHVSESADEWTFETIIDVSDDEFKYLLDHKIQGKILFPAASFLELITTAVGMVQSASGKLLLRNFMVLASLELERDISLNTVCYKLADYHYKVEVCHEDSDNRKVFAKADAHTDLDVHSPAVFSHFNLKGEHTDRLESKEVYSKFSQIGFQYGHEYQTVSSLQLATDSAHVNLLDGSTEFSPVFDFLLQSMILSQLTEQPMELVLPFHLESIVLHQSMTSLRSCIVSNTKYGQGYMLADCVALDVWEVPVCHIKNAQFRQPVGAQLDTDMSYTLVWHTVSDNKLMRHTVHESVLVLGEDSELLSDTGRVFSSLIFSITADIHELNRHNSASLLASIDGLCDSNTAVLFLHTASFFSRLALLRSIQCMLKSRKESYFCVLSECPQVCMSHDPLSMTSAYVTGILKALSAEYPQRDIGQILLAASSELVRAIGGFLSTRSSETLLYLDNNTFSMRLEKQASVVMQTIKKPDHEMSTASIHLITGGVSGLGLETAKWALGHGATDLILTSRNPSEFDVKQIIDFCRLHGGCIETANFDVSKNNETYDVSNSCSAWSQTTHSAGILNDSLLTSMTLKLVETVSKPKLFGAMNLHVVCKQYQQNSFTVYTSISSILGIIGQSNYAAANAMADSMCSFRLQHGFAAHSINWGNWAKVGMAADLADAFISRGMLALQPEKAVLVLDVETDYLGQTIFVNMQWDKFIDRRPDMLALISPSVYKKETPKPTTTTARQLRESVASISKADTPAVIKIVEDAVRKVLGIPEQESLDRKQGLLEMGLDSVGAVELVELLQQALGSDIAISSTIVFDYPNITALVKYIEPFTQSTTNIDDIVAKAVRRVLGLDANEQLDNKQGLLEMGIDSVGAVELVEYIQNDLGSDIILPATVVFDYPNITALVAHLLTMIEIDTDDETVSVFDEPMEEPKFEVPSIVVLGSSCQFPAGSDSLESYWNCFLYSKDGICQIPGDRWNYADYYDSSPDTPGKTTVTRGAFISKPIIDFDCFFFSIAPLEATYLDPQQRLLLQTSWRAIETGQLRPEQLSIDTGVYIGAVGCEYMEIAREAAISHAYANTGMLMSVMSGRLAYFYGFQGPALTIDTACSSSLTSISTAVGAMRSKHHMRGWEHECDTKRS